MWLVVGLGNPGAEYRSTRHNIGFMAADALAGSAACSKKFQGEVAEVILGGEKVLLLKPQTYMNHSGRSVQAAAAFYKIAPEHIVVIHDELDLPLGKIRIKRGGGHNGHNGIKDIDAAIGPEYWRIRLGIGHPGSKDAVHGHVLNAFSKEEKPLLEKLLAAFVQHFPLFITHSPAALMSKVSDAIHPPEKKSPAKAEEA